MQEEESYRGERGADTRQLLRRRPTNQRFVALWETSELVGAVGGGLDPTGSFRTSTIHVEVGNLGHSTLPVCRPVGGPSQVPRSRSGGERGST